MADQNQNFNTEDVEATRVAKAEADAAEKVRVAAEEKRVADEAAAETAKQDEIAAQIEDEVPTVAVVLDPEYADECDCDVATVGTANGEYELSSTPVDVPQTDLENVLTSPAAKEQN